MRILLLSSWFPYPPDNGSKIRAYHLLLALARRHEVTLLTFANARESNDAAPLADVCRVAAVVPSIPFQPGRRRARLGYLSPAPRSVADTHSAEMAQLVVNELAGGRHDVVVALQSGTASYVRNGLPAQRIFDEVETSVIRESWRSSPPGPARWRRWLTWIKTRRYLGQLVRHFAACTVVSERERANLREIAPGYNAIHLIPNGVDTHSLSPGMAAPRPGVLIYNGALTYSANYDAMCHFLGEIWPIVRAQAPEARLLITGRTEGVSIGGLPLDDHVTLTGYLPDIRPAVAGAWACVVPLRVGGGTRLKILEAMALGTPVVATTKGAEGLAVTPEMDILISDSSEGFAAQVVRLCREPDLRHRLAENGRRLVEARYSWQSIGNEFNRLVESVAGNGLMKDEHRVAS
jgi:glycosyltransferase involved in cell wall biosynthesis